MTKTKTLHDYIVECHTESKFHIQVEWARARLLGDIHINKAGKYLPWGETPNTTLWALALKLSRFAQGKMAIANKAFWNERNPNPHLP